MPMPGQGLPRAAGSDPAETLASTLVSPRTADAATTRACPCPAWTSGRTSIGYWLAVSRNAEPEHKTEGGPDWPRERRSMKTTRARRVRRAALFAVSAVGVAATVITASTGRGVRREVRPERRLPGPDRGVPARRAGQRPGQQVRRRDSRRRRRIGAHPGDRDGAGPRPVRPGAGHQRHHPRRGTALRRRPWHHREPGDEHTAGRGEPVPDDHGSGRTGDVTVPQQGRRGYQAAAGFGL